MSKNLRYFFMIINFLLPLVNEIKFCYRKRSLKYSTELDPLTAPFSH